MAFNKKKAIIQVVIQIVMYNVLDVEQLPRYTMRSDSCV